MRKIDHAGSSLFHCIIYNVSNEKEEKYVDIRANDILGVFNEIQRHYPGFRLALTSERPFAHTKWEW